MGHMVMLRYASLEHLQYPTKRTVAACVTHGEGVPTHRPEYATNSMCAGTYAAISWWTLPKDMAVHSVRSRWMSSEQRCAIIEMAWSLICVQPDCGESTGVTPGRAGRR